MADNFAECVVGIHLPSSGRPELSAAMTVAAVLMAGMLTKLGHGGWGIGVIAALLRAWLRRRASGLGAAWPPIFMGFL
jgi:hypothetical protein